MRQYGRFEQFTKVNDLAANAFSVFMHGIGNHHEASMYWSNVDLGLQKSGQGVIDVMAQNQSQGFGIVATSGLLPTVTFGNYPPGRIYNIRSSFPGNQTAQPQNHIESGTTKSHVVAMKMLMQCLVNCACLGTFCSGRLVTCGSGNAQFSRYLWHIPEARMFDLPYIEEFQLGTIAL
jgi:hypothetical protein